MDRIRTTLKNARKYVSVRLNLKSNKTEKVQSKTARKIWDGENLSAMHMNKHVWTHDRNRESFEKWGFLYSQLRFQFYVRSNIKSPFKCPTKAIQIEQNTLRWKFHLLCGQIVKSTKCVDTVQLFPQISWKSFEFHLFRGQAALQATQKMSTFLAEFKIVFKDQEQQVSRS